MYVALCMLHKLHDGTLDRYVCMCYPCIHGVCVCMYVCILCNGMNTCRFITHTQMSHYSLVGVSRSLSRNAHLYVVAQVCECCTVCTRILGVYVAICMYTCECCAMLHVAILYSYFTETYMDLAQMCVLVLWNMSQCCTRILGVCVCTYEYFRPTTCIHGVCMYVYFGSLCMLHKLHVVCMYTL